MPPEMREMLPYFTKYCEGLQYLSALELCAGVLMHQVHHSFYPPARFHDDSNSANGELLFES